MATRTIPTTIYKLDVEALLSDDPLAPILPIEIHHPQDGVWIAVYAEAEDVEYPDLIELLRDHGISDHDALAGCETSQYMREVELELSEWRAVELAKVLRTAAIAQLAAGEVWDPEDWLPMDAEAMAVFGAEERRVAFRAYRGE